MPNSIISEGKTTNEAIENGLKKLNVSKNQVDIKVLESDDKRSFFSILAPRVVKVELTLKESNAEENIEKESKSREIKKYSAQELDIGHEAGYLIGYRGETLYSLQNILISVASKSLTSRVRVILDIEDYKNKREKTLEDLADRMAKKVIRTGKSVTLEPMKAYERKIIHSKLQASNKVTTHSIGEEPRRRLVISLK